MLMNYVYLCNGYHVFVLSFWFSAISVHSWLPGSRNLRKSVHLSLQGLALASGISGIWTKFHWDRGFLANFHSLHSWMGLVVITLFGAQVFFSLHPFYFSFTPYQTFNHLQNWIWWMELRIRKSLTEGYVAEPESSFIFTFQMPHSSEMLRINAKWILVVICYWYWQIFSINRAYWASPHNHCQTKYWYWRSTTHPLILLHCIRNLSQGVIYCWFLIFQLDYGPLPFIYYCTIL